MNPPPTTIRTVKPEPAREPSRNKFSHSVRTALLMVLVAALMYVGFGLGGVFAEWRQTARPAPPTTMTAFELNPLGTALPLSGQWSFADLNWNLRSMVMSGTDVDARLEVLANPPTGDVNSYQDVSVDLLRLIETLHLQPIERSGYQLYRLNRNDLKAQLLVRKVDGHTKAVTFAGAYPQNGQQWQMFELTPCGTSSMTVTRSAHLLPLPDNAVRCGGRFADDGQLLLELISLDTQADTLIAAWKSAGWEVRPSGLSDVPGFSFLCARGNDVIYAWSANAGESLKNLMLVRSPTDEELQAEQLTTIGSNRK